MITIIIIQKWQLWIFSCDDIQHFLERFSRGRNIGYKSWAINIAILDQINAFAIYKHKLANLNWVFQKLNLCSLLASCAKICLTTGFIFHSLIYYSVNEANIICAGQTRSSRSCNCCYHYREKTQGNLLHGASIMSFQMKKIHWSWVHRKELVRLDWEFDIILSPLRVRDMGCDHEGGVYANVSENCITAELLWIIMKVLSCLFSLTPPPYISTPAYPPNHTAPWPPTSLAGLGGSQLEPKCHLFVYPHSQGCSGVSPSSSGEGTLTARYMIEHLLPSRFFFC